jgi:HEAT repeat protein
VTRGWRVGAALGAGLLAALALRVALVPRERPAAPAAPPALAFHPGDRQALRLTLDSSVRLTQGGRTQDAGQRLAGTLHLRVFEPGVDGARVGLQLANASLTLGDQASAALDLQLGRPFLVTFAADGSPSAFRFSPATGEEAQGLLEETLRTFQAIVPAGVGTTWTTEERHGSGRYRADYRATRDGRILKAKVAYLDDAGKEGGGKEGGGTALRVTVRRAESTFRVEPGVSWVAQAVVTEALDASLGEGITTASTLHGELVRQPLAPPVASLLELDGWPGTWDGFAAALAREPSAPSAKPRVPPDGAAELEALVRELQGADGMRASLLYGLRDLLRRDPKAAARILALLRRPPPDATAAALLNALGMAATPEAQAALWSVADDPGFGRMNRTRALLALGDTGWAIEEGSLALLRSVAARGGPLGDTAVLALGIAGDGLRQLGAARYEEVRADLVHRAGTNAGQDGAVAIYALGNTHDAELSDTVAARLDDASPAVRTAAASTLGTLGGQVDPDLLVARLAVEDDRTVRSAIGTALNALPPPDAAALALVAQAVAREQDPQARLELAKLLGENLAAYPEGRTTLIALSKQDRSSRVRVYASHALWGRHP